MQFRTALVLFFFFNDTATTEIYTLSLHDALPICFPESHAYSFAMLAYASAWLKRHEPADRKSTRLNSSHLVISYAVFCLKKKTNASPYFASRRRISSAFLSTY